MFYQFAHRQVPCIVDGTAEKVVLTRDSRSSAVIVREYLYTGLFSPSSLVNTGSLVEAEGETFFVQTKRHTAEKDWYCGLIKTNAVIDVYRFSRKYDEHDNPIEEEFQPIEMNVKAFMQYVTAQLRQDDAGLLATTKYLLQLQKNVDIKRPQEVAWPDRVIFKGRSYQVDVIDDVRYPNLLYIQLGEDTR